jgi:hypothetical protein
LDTVYATVGKKPTLFRLLVEAVISGHNEAVPAEERDYVHAIRAEPDAARKLQIYAAAARSIQPRLAPFFQGGRRELWSRLKFEGSCYVLIKLACSGRLGDAALGSLHRLGDGGIGHRPVRPARSRV